MVLQPATAKHLTQAARRLVEPGSEVDAADVGDHATGRIEVRGRVEGRAAERKGRPLIDPHPGHHRLQQARFSDPGLAAHDRGVRAAGEDLPPEVAEPLALVIAVDERAGLGLGLDPARLRCLAEDLVRVDRVGHALEREASERLDLEVPAHEPMRVLADHETPRRSVVLEAGGHVRRLTDDGVALGAGRGTHLAANHHPGVDRDSNRELDPVAFLDRRAELAQPRAHVEAGHDPPQRVVLMRGRVAEVGEHAVAEQPCDVTVVAAHGGVDDLLVCAQRLAIDLRVVLRRQAGRADDVGEHHRQLSPLPLLGAREPALVEQAPGVLVLRVERQHRLGEGSDRRRLVPCGRIASVVEQFRHAPFEPLIPHVAARSRVPRAQGA